MCGYSLESPDPSQRCSDDHREGKRLYPHEPWAEDNGRVKSRGKESVRENRKNILAQLPAVAPPPYPRWAGFRMPKERRQMKTWSETRYGEELGFAFCLVLNRGSRKTCVTQAWRRRCCTNPRVCLVLYLSPAAFTLVPFDYLFVFLPWSSP